MTRLAKRAFFLAAIVAVSRSSTQAADVTSTYSSGPPANWTTAAWINSPPVVAYPNNGNAGVGTFDVVINTSNLTLDRDIVVQQLTMNDGTVTGTFSLTTNDLLHFAGLMSGGGITNAKGGLQIDETLNIDARTLNISGPTAFTGGASSHAGYLRLSSGATINNSGAFDAGWGAGYDNFISPNGTSGAFNNSGTFTRSVGVGTTDVIVPFNNSNSVTVQAGTLLIEGGGAEAGSFQVASGAVLNISGSGLTLAAGASLAGPGTTMINNTTTVTGPSVTFSGGGILQLTSLGTLNGPGTLTATAPVDWAGGTMSGKGITNANGGLQIDGYPNLLDTRTLNIGGPTSFTGDASSQGGVLFLSNGATINNSGTFDAGWAANFNNSIVLFGTSGGTFNNSGTLKRSAGAGTTTISVPFTNSGAVAVQAGTLEIDVPSTLSASSSLVVNGTGRLRFKANSGASTVGTGITATVSNIATLELAGSISALSSSLSPLDRVKIHNDSTAAAGGLLVSGTHQQVGNIDGLGSVVVNAGSDLTANHIIQSALTIGGAAGSTGRVTIDASDASGNPLIDAPTSLLNEPSSLASNGQLGAGGISSADLSSGADGGTDLAAVSPGNSAAGGNLSPVPEPSTLRLVLVALSSVIGQRITLCHRARRNGF